MTRNTSQADDWTVLDAVLAFAEQALADGVHPAHLSYALTVVATRTGLDLAPTAGEALALVIKAASDVAMEWASAQHGHDANQVDCASAPSETIH